VPANPAAIIHALLILLERAPQRVHGGRIAETTVAKLLIGAFVLWLAGLVLACLRFSTSARWLIGLGAAAGVAGSVSALPHGGTDLTLPIALGRSGNSRATTRRRRLVDEFRARPGRL